MMKSNFYRSKGRIPIPSLMQQSSSRSSNPAIFPPPIRLPSSRFASSSTSSTSTSIRKPFIPPPTPPGQKAPSPLTPKVGTLFIALTSLALALTATGLYQFYQSFSTWPKELRDHLRSALKAKQREDYTRAEREFTTALAKARALPPNVLGKDPILKTTGIAIALASMLEDQHEYSKAYSIYSEALDEVLQQSDFQPTDEVSRVERTPQERMRAVALAQRLGDLARLPRIEINSKLGDSDSNLIKKGSSSNEEILKPLDLAEKHLVWSVEELLKLSIPEETRNEILNKNKESSNDDGDGDGIMLSDLELPSWVTHSELGASLEALGSFYAEKGKVDYAVPLYLQALAILLPGSTSPSSSSANPHFSAEDPISKINNSSLKKKQPTVADRCRASVLMNNLGQLFINGSSTNNTNNSDNKVSKESLIQGKAWTEKGLDIILKTQRMTGWDNRGKGAISTSKTVEESEERTNFVKMECYRSEVTLLFNLGVISEMMSDECDARKYFQRAYKRAEEIGMRDARSRAAVALSRLQRLDK